MVEETTVVNDTAEATIIPAPTNITTTAQIESGDTKVAPDPNKEEIVPSSAGVASVRGISQTSVDPDQVTDPQIALNAAKTHVSKLHTLIHNLASAADFPFKEVAKLYGELGTLLGKI